MGTPSPRPGYRRLKVAVVRDDCGPKSYFVHHTQRITKAAVMHDAKAILKQVVSTTTWQLYR